MHDFIKSFFGEPEDRYLKFVERVSAADGDVVVFTMPTGTSPEVLARISKNLSSAFGLTVNVVLVQDDIKLSHIVARHQTKNQDDADA